MQRVIGVLGVVLMTLGGIGLAPRVTAHGKDEAQVIANVYAAGGDDDVWRMRSRREDGGQEDRLRDRRDVSYEKGTADISYDPTKTNPEAIAKAITDKSGFPASVPKKSNK